MSNHRSCCCREDVLAGDQPCVFIILGGGGEVKIGDHESAHRWTDSSFLEAWYGPESSFCAINEDIIHPIVDADAHFIDNEFVFEDSNGKRKVRVGYEVVLEPQNVLESYIHNHQSFPLDTSRYEERYEGCPCMPHCGGWWGQQSGYDYWYGNCCPYGENPCESHCNTSYGWYGWSYFVSWDYPNGPREKNLPNGGCSNVCGSGVGAYVSGDLESMAERLNDNHPIRDCACNFQDCPNSWGWGNWWQNDCEPITQEEWEQINSTPFNQWRCSNQEEQQYRNLSLEHFFVNEFGWYGYTLDERPWMFPFECWGCGSGGADDDGGFLDECNNHCECICNFFNTDNYLDIHIPPSERISFSVTDPYSGYSYHNSYGSLTMLSGVRSFLSSRGVGKSNGGGIFSDTPCTTPYYYQGEPPEGYIPPNGYYTLDGWESLNIQTVCEPDPPQCMDLPFEKYFFTPYFNSNILNTLYTGSGWPGSWGGGCGGNSVEDMVSSIIDEITSRFGPPVFPTGNINPYPKNIFFIDSSSSYGTMGSVSSLAMGIRDHRSASIFGGGSEKLVEIVGQFVKQYDERYGKEVTNRLFNPCQQFISPDIPDSESSNFQVNLSGESDTDTFCWVWDETIELDTNYDGIIDTYGAYDYVCGQEGQNSWGCNLVERLYISWGGGTYYWDYWDYYYPGSAHSAGDFVPPYSIFASYLGDDAHMIRGPFSFGSHAPYDMSHYGNDFINAKWFANYGSWNDGKLDIPYGVSNLSEASPPNSSGIVGGDCNNTSLANSNHYINPGASPLVLRERYGEQLERCNANPEVISKTNVTSSFGLNEGMCNTQNNGYWVAGWPVSVPFSNRTIGNEESCAPYERFNYETEELEMFYPCADYGQGPYNWHGTLTSPDGRWWPEDTNDLGTCDYDIPPGSGGTLLGVPTDVAEAIYYSRCPYHTPETCESAKSNCEAAGWIPPWCDFWEEVDDCSQCLGYENEFWNDRGPGTVNFYNHGNIENIIRTNVISNMNVDYMLALTTVLNAIHNQQHCDCEKEILFGRTCTGIFLPENEFWSADDVLRQPFFWKVGNRIGGYGDANTDFIHDRPYCNSYANTLIPGGGPDGQFGFLEGLLEGGTWRVMNENQAIFSERNYVCTFDMLPNSLPDFPEGHDYGGPVDLAALGKCSEIYDWAFCPY